jgi:hypothetical protein
MAQAAYPRVALWVGLRRRKGSAFVAANHDEAAATRTLTRRAGPALPSYLALHHAGFSLPRVLPPERWALTPPFHPCQTKRAVRRRLAGLPARCHRAAYRRRYIFCGTFRERTGQRTPKLAQPKSLPWRYQARCPLPSSALIECRPPRVGAKPTRSFP